jgi:hypothetical protein
MYAIETASNGFMYIPSFMEMGPGIQAISRFWRNSLMRINVGISDVSNL